MADRKQTPDILSEIMSGPPLPPANKQIEVGKPQAGKLTRTTKNTAKLSASQRTNRINWEYKLVSFQDYKGVRPRFVNGVEIQNWMNAPLIHEYIDQLAQEGWEIAAASSGQRLYGLSDTHQLYLKRQRSKQKD